MTSRNPLAEPPPSMTDSALAAVLADGWDLAPARLRRFASEQDITMLVDDRYFLKVSKPAISPALIDMEIKAMAHLARHCDVEVPRTVPDSCGDTGQAPHVARLLTKLDARDRVQLVIAAYESGLITPPR